jgi:methylmalonyl-CoA/ethylmalonyl-CoA epimerase
MDKIEHIGIAVKSLDISIPLFEQLLGSNCYKQEIVENEKVKTAFFKIGETKIELLEDGNEQGIINRFIEKKGEGMHHIAFAVENIVEEVERLKSAGFEFIQEEARRGADNKLICFLHPKGTNGVLIELCQEIQ